MNCLRKRCDTMSMTLTATMMMIRMAQVWASWNPRIASHKVTPMPPAPTMPTTVADRTFDSKRYSAYELHKGSTCGMTRAEERSVGKECFCKCRARWSKTNEKTQPYHKI